MFGTYIILLFRTIRMNELCGLSLGEIKEVYARICSFVTGKKLNLIPESAEKKVLVKGNGSSYKKS